MKITGLLLFIYLLPVASLAQNVTSCKPLPYLDYSFKNWQNNQYAGHINLGDSLINHLSEAFIKYEYDDTTEHYDSSFYQSNYITGTDTFSFIFKTQNIHIPDGNHSLDYRYIYLTVNANGQLLLPEMEIYSTEYVESYGEENHCFIVDENGDKIPDLVFVGYNFSSFIEGDEFNCKRCSLIHLTAKKFEVTGIRNCPKLLAGFEVPFALK